ncbi:portal protein [Akkermansiaceae bacterium]|nr:portal protein [Akkermansiaceae bacterium]|tara:strand:- start:1442 stop:2998 length:1557 start_codon:yes stop_codon:yes gene_type:complete
MHAAETAQQLYTTLEGARYSYLDRGRTCSKLTLPYVMPEEGFGPHSRLETPFSGVGSRGVNNLASKLLLALLPPNSPFFRFQANEKKLAEDETPPELMSEIEASLQALEELVMDEVTRGAYRVALHEALKHLIITGNALLYLPDEGGLRVFHLDRFVVQRDPMGNLLSVATKESVAFSTLSEEIRQRLQQQDPNLAESDAKVDLFTSCKRKAKHWEITQDVNGVDIPYAGGKVTMDRNPFIPLRLSRIDGEAYGRGFVEEYLGDIQSLEALTRAIVEGSAAAAKVLFLVNPNGTTRARTLAESPNGAIVQGNAADVNTLQLDKFNDFRTAQVTMEAIKDRLGAAFLLTSGVVRQAERVTAEEIRMLSQELEASLGGLYSLLAAEMQLPLVKRIMSVMQKKKLLPKLPKDLVKPVIVTGVEALGRGNDLSKLDLFLAGAAQVVGPEAIGQFVNVEDYFKRRATALGIKTEGLIKSAEQMQQEAQMQQMQAMTEKLGPAGIKALNDQAMAGNMPSVEPQE